METQLISRHAARQILKSTEDGATFQTPALFLAPKPGIGRAGRRHAVPRHRHPRGGAETQTFRKVPFSAGKSHLKPGSPILDRAPILDREVQFWTAVQNGSSVEESGAYLSLEKKGPP